MPLAKKATLTLVLPRNLKKELEILYARRSAVDAVIESLEDYHRLQAGQAEHSKRRTA